MAIEARLIVVRGRVQGVGFRHHTRVRARELDLDGWVRNCADGSVEVWARGATSQLDLMIEFLRRGPAGARVDALHVTGTEPGPTSVGFRVLASI